MRTAPFFTGTSSTRSGSLCTSLSTLFELQTDPFLLVPVAAIGLGYLIGYRRYASRARAPRTRGALFLLGYAALVIALISPLHAVGEEYFSVHMVQHLILTLVAPPLLLLSGSMPVLLWALPRKDRRTLGRLVGQSGPLRTVLRWLTKPVVAWFLFVGTQWLWHQPVGYEWALENRWAHYFEHIAFFVTAVLFWWPVVGAAPLPSPLSYPARFAYTFLAWMPNTLLGAGITLSRGPLYTDYVSIAHLNGSDAGYDQQLAGLIMWIPGDVLFATILLMLFVAFMQNEERKEARIDRELDALEAAHGGPVAYLPREP